MIYIALVIALIALVAAVVSWLQTDKLKKRFTSTLGGEDTGSLEHSLTSYFAQIQAVDMRLSQLNTEYERLAVTNSLAQQKISIVRFNPFGDTGGDQSFSLAVLDAHDSGYVLTSIHGREGTRIYVKPIDYGKSKYTLSAEEQQVLSQAIKRIPQLEES